MKNIKIRLEKLKEKSIEKNKMPLILAVKNTDGLYTFHCEPSLQDKTYTQAEFDKFISENDSRIGTLIVDDIAAWEE